MSKAELAYLAGIIEGEGGLSITIDTSGKRTYYQAFLSVQMGEREIIEWVASVFSGTCRKIAISQPKFKQQWATRCPAKNLEAVLRATIPFMKSPRRKREAELLIKLQRTMGYNVHHRVPLSVWEYRENLYREMRQLKQEQRGDKE